MRFLPGDSGEVRDVRAVRLHAPGGHQHLALDQDRHLGVRQRVDPPHPQVGFMLEPNGFET